MKQTIRFNTFETNSSSTHSMVVIPDEYYEDWNKNELFYLDKAWTNEEKKLLELNNNCKFFNREFLENLEVSDETEKMPIIDNYEDDLYYQEDLQQWCNNLDLMNKSNWESRELEYEEEIYTTKQGEILHILCRFGYDS